MKNFINRFIRSDYDIVILRLSVIGVFMLFGTYKWFDFEVMALEPLISSTWLNILYLIFGCPRGKLFPWRYGNHYISCVDHWLRPTWCWHIWRSHCYHYRSNDSEPAATTGEN